ncbi:FG-GAP-like repeat-containing protein [Planctobacterium marinum]|uniref:ASPIC/UnbV domain-containing protein n=1 Tax=Planctobacterium marinum TaxID=1631968 RepID=A0AA48HIM7_9ALTE|nr:hypothetical protein MACH26_31190 [Planctobacterium marinum]
MNSIFFHNRFKTPSDFKLQAICTFVLVLFLSKVSAQESEVHLEQIIGHIEALENVRDPKCYATASRLEDFIYGTPLEHRARFRKNLLQKQWISHFWEHASRIAAMSGESELNEKHIVAAVKPVIRWQQEESGHWLVTLGSGNQLKIHKDDKRQYSTIAYSLRSLLAVQQDLLLSAQEQQLMPLSISATDKLAEALDFFLLSVLQVADREARTKNLREVDENLLVSAWSAISQLNSTVSKKYEDASVKRDIISPVLFNKMVEQKLRSYSQYNELNNQIFVRNLQVFFARHRWPESSIEAKQFRQLFTETVISFASDLYRGAQELALEHGRNVILEEDVFNYAQYVLPHRINEYEDAIFFPALPAKDRVTIEAYDMDAFRDSGIHWQYMQFALNDALFPIYLEPDPFAAELLVENIAQYGVLVLRVMGDIGRSEESERIKVSFFRDAVNAVNYFARENNKAEKHKGSDVSLRLISAPSAEAVEKSKIGTNGTLFTEVSSSVGINFMHRSSDWLSRLLRSYLTDGKGRGTIVIPPAFGGSGIAAGDINNDGYDDVLLLSGLGNRLYLNDGKGKFKDITESAGLNWVREPDNLPGEPRQPIIADLDNDGWQDIVITYVDDLHRVYRNKGDNTFEDVSEGTGLGGVGLVGGPATVFDFDGDGLLDIYITYFGNYLKGVLPTLRRRNINGLPNKLFRNLGKLKFQDVTQDSGVDNSGWGQAVTHTDFNSDGLQDLVVGNDFGVNAYYKNLGNGKFIDVADELGTNKPSYTMGIALGDLNQDLISDIYISNIVTMNKDEKYVLPSADTEMKFNPNKLARMRVIEANDLFLSRNTGDLRFELSDRVGRGYSSTGWSWDADFFDFDNDGDDDLYVLNGMNDYLVYSQENPYYQDPIKNREIEVLFPKSDKEKNVLFVNDDGMLNNASAGSGLDFSSNGRSAIYLDIDNDGDLDIITNDYHEKSRVLLNHSEADNNNWLKLSLSGDPTRGINLDAIGAKVIVETADGLKRTRELSGTIGYMSVHSKQMHFGLGAHKSAKVTIIWPNGERGSLGSIDANQVHRFAYDFDSVTQVTN